MIARARREIALATDNAIKELYDRTAELAVQVAGGDVPRISPEFLAEERDALGEVYFRQEYECSFESRQGLVYRDFVRCLFSGPVPEGRKVGGIDFGAPFDKLLLFNGYALMPIASVGDIVTFLTHDKV